MFQINNWTLIFWRRLINHAFLILYICRVFQNLALLLFFRNRYASFVTIPIRLYSLSYFLSFLVNTTIPLYLLKGSFTWKLWYPTHICLLLCFMLCKHSLPGIFCKIKSFFNKVVGLSYLFSKNPCEFLLVEEIK